MTPTPKQPLPSPATVVNSHPTRRFAVGDVTADDEFRHRPDRHGIRARARPALRSVALWLTVAGLSGCTIPAQRPVPRPPQVLFVCEHGNVKSLMAASYFNAVAKERGLTIRAISRGSAPDSASVPPVVVDGLRRDGVDVSQFMPTAVGEADVGSSLRVILINAELPAALRSGAVQEERWNDVPAATLDFAAARAALQDHVRTLLDELSSGPLR